MQKTLQDVLRQNSRFVVDWSAMAWGRQQLVCQSITGKVKYPNIDAFTTKTRGFFAKIAVDKGFVDFVRDPHNSISPRSNLHNGTNVKILLPLWPADLDTNMQNMNWF